jgi:hypothetical protein
LSVRDGGLLSYGVDSVDTFRFRFLRRYEPAQ